MSRLLMPLILLFLLLGQMSSLLDSEKTVLLLHQIVTVIVWIFVAASIIVAILLFVNGENGIRKLLIAELICTVVIGICLLILPILDSRLDGFQQHRIDTLEKTLKKATNDLAAATSPKPIDEKIRSFMNEIDPTILTRLKTNGAPLPIEISLAESKYEKLWDLYMDPSSHDFFVITTESSRATATLGGIMEQVDFVVLTNLLNGSKWKPPGE